MKPETLFAIKQRISKLFVMYSVLVENWNHDSETYPQTTAMMVLLQNASVDYVGADGYTHEKAVNDLKRMRRCIEVLADYDNSYMTRYPAQEISFIIDGECFSEDYDEYNTPGRL